MIVQSKIKVLFNWISWTTLVATKRLIYKVFKMKWHRMKWHRTNGVATQSHSATERILAWQTGACCEAHRNRWPTYSAQYWPAFGLWATVQFPAKPHTAGSSWISSCMQTTLCPSPLHLNLGRMHLGRVPATLLSLKRTEQELPATCDKMADASFL